MAMTFDDLVGQLLYDIALAGSHGIDAAELSKAVTEFYKPHQSRTRKSVQADVNAYRNDGDLLFSEAPPAQATNVDEAFLDTVWDWLERHPDIHIIAAEDTDGRAHSSKNDYDGSSARRHAGKRITTSEDRIWQAIAGHGVDHARIPAKHFECLSVIAAHGPDGILQPDLRRITDQDKRSLPKRTDVLAERGYITKEQVIGGGNNTTLLKLRRFAKKDIPAGPKHVHAYPQSKKPVVEEPVLLYDSWFDELMQLLKANDNIIAVTDLLIGVGLLGKPWETKCFRRCYNRLVRAGCLRKLSARTADETGREEGEWVRCIQLLREPTDDDRLWFKKNAGPKKGKKLVHTLAPQRSHAEDSEEDTATDDEETENVGDPLKPRPVPQWTPELPYTTAVYNVLSEAGPSGLSSTALNESLTGPFWRRPLDEVMLRLTDIWQHSQPPHLKHLAIVRDTAVSGKQATFSFRTFENFKKAVELGETAWEAVVGGQEGKARAKQGGLRRNEGKLDSWGFPVLGRRDLAASDGRASLRECAGLAIGDVGTPLTGKKSLGGISAIAWKSSPTPSRNVQTWTSEGANLMQTLRTPNTTAPNLDLPRILLSGSAAPSSHSTPTKKRTAQAAGLDVDQSMKKVPRMVGTTLSAILSSRPPSAVPSFRSTSAGTLVNDNITASPGTINLPVNKRTTVEYRTPSARFVQINPPGSYPRHLIKPGARRKVLVAVIKSERLNSVGWFNPSTLAVSFSQTSPENVQNISGTPQVSTANERRPLTAPPLASKSAAVDPSANTPQHAQAATKDQLLLPRAATLVSTAGTTESSTATNTPKKRAREDDDKEEADQERSTAPAPRNKIKLPKRDKRGRPSKAEAAERERLRAEIARTQSKPQAGSMGLKPPSQGVAANSEGHAAESIQGPSTPEPGSLAALLANASGIPPQQKPSLIVKLFITNSVQRLRAQPNFVIPSAVSGQPPPHEARSSPQPLPTPSGTCVHDGLSPQAQPSESDLNVHDTQRANTAVDGPSAAEARLIDNEDVHCTPLEFQVQNTHDDSHTRPTSHNKGQASSPTDPYGYQDSKDNAGRATTQAWRPSPLFEVDKNDPATPSVRTYSKAGTTRNGGIIQLRRAKLVQDIVRKAGGAFPGDYEMWYPFATHWQRLYKQTPDRNTVEHAVAGLLQDGKLKRLGFTFKNDRGEVLQRHVIVEPHLDATSAKAKYVQRQIISMYPYRYLPESVQIETHLREKAREFPAGPAQTVESDTIPMDDSDDDYTPSRSAGQQPQAYPGTLPAEFPEAEGITVKRTSTYNAALQSGVLPEGVKRLAGIRKTPRPPREYRPRRGSHTDNLVVQSDVEDDDDEDLDERQPTPAAQAALMSELQVDNYVHDPTAVRSQMYRPRPRATLGPRSENDIPNWLVRKQSSTLGDGVASGNSTSNKPSKPGLKPRAKPGPKPRGRPGPKPKDKPAPNLQANIAPPPLPQPQSLDDFLQLATTFGHVAPDPSETLFWQFQCEVDRVMAVELESVKAGQLVGSPGGWVNILHVLNCPHVLPEPAEQEPMLEFVDGTLSMKDAEILRRSLAAKGRADGAEALARKTSEVVSTMSYKASNAGVMMPVPRLPWTSLSRPATTNPAASTTTSVESSSRPSRRMSSQPSDLSSTASTTPPPPETPYNTRSKGKARIRFSFAEEETPIMKPKLTPAKIPTYTLPRKEQPTKAEQECLAIAIALFKVLCAGADRSATLKWEMISHALAFHVTPDFAQQRWKSQARTQLGNSFVQKLECAIHEPFLKAYEKGELPPVNFNKLEKTDWPGLVRWVQQKILPLEKSVKVTSLPSSRTALEERYNVNIAPLSSTGAIAEKDLIPVVKVQDGGASVGSTLDHNAILEKSWIRGLVATKDDVYNERQATLKLAAVDSSVLEKVIDEMKRTKTLTHAYKGRRQPGRNFVLTPYFFSNFARWPGDSSGSSVFMSNLVSAWQDFANNFHAQDRLELRPDVSEAQMMVLSSMLAMGHIRLAPVLPPMSDNINAPPGTLSKWGIGGYTHRPKHFEEAPFRLAVVCTKTDAFTDQHNLKLNVPPPMHVAAIDGETGPRIPLWVDIHGNFIRGNWEMVLRSVLHVLVHKPGCTANAIEAAHDTKLWSWEIELVLAWMEEVGVAMRSGVGSEIDGLWNGGWKTGDWWFLTFLKDVMGG